MAFFGEEITHLVMECTDDKSLDKVQRKHLQIEHAKTVSVGAKLIKIADKLSNNEGLLIYRPADWSDERIKGYFVWSKAVLDNLMGVSEYFDERIQKFYHAVQLDKMSNEELNQQLGIYYKTL